ncbi:MAG: hypothetical protein K5644_06825 [Lachnospiraceae bacterium]|nr:hypothetical protein [Lachnospiraceae bacterium]
MSIPICYDYIKTNKATLNLHRQDEELNRPFMVEDLDNYKDIEERIRASEPDVFADEGDIPL